MPGQGVTWEAVDGHSARATLTDGDVSATLLFTFDAGGLVDTVYAGARARTVNGEAVATPWLGRFWNYAVHDGLRVPFDGEVAWLLPDGPRPYWRGHITRLHYERAQ